MLNSLALATDKYPEAAYASKVQKVNRIFTYLFTAESILKLMALTYTKFVKDRFNIFDLVIVLASLAEMFLGSSNQGIVSSARAFRLARLFKLARNNQTLKSLIDSIV